MTGGDTITARTAYAKMSVEVKPTWVVFMPTNHKPIIKGTDNGIWRRLVLLPFERNFDEDKSIQKDPLRQSKLAAELEGILAALVRAAIRFKKTGFFAPAKVQAARDAYRTNMDLLAEWLEECCEVGASFEVPTQHLWASWESYAKSRGLLNYINSSVRLSRRLDGRFETRKGTGGIRMRMGLRLKDDFSEVLP
jgi:P4 family phage/plasmid primase-like protien